MPASVVVSPASEILSVSCPSPRSMVKLLAMSLRVLASFLMVSWSSSLPVLIVTWESMLWITMLSVPPTVLSKTSVVGTVDSRVIESSSEPVLMIS